VSAAGICFVNTELAGGASSLRVVGDRIAGVGVPPRHDDVVVDLEGDRLLPGLINAHEHLQFNHFNRTRFRERYENVAEWIADITLRRDDDEGLRAAVSLPLRDRLFAGAIKNLLSGATTVAHHDAFQDLFVDGGFPVRVLRASGWTHSLALSGDAAVRQSHLDTPRDWPWFVHAGEGVDAAAAAEFLRLRELGCIAGNTLLVHGAGFDRALQRQLIDAGAAVVWCPSSNLFLFGRTLDPALLFDAGRLALGSDSRISGARDLLDELRIARGFLPGCDSRLEMLVTRGNARLLRLDDRGVLVRGALADLVVIPAGQSLADTSRSQLRMVMVAGRMRFGDGHCAARLSQYAACSPVELDGVDKVLDRALVEELSRAAWLEPGLRLSNAQWIAA
jgi:cytosine/adenosine deaminase-related metal-dependent hydrolase